MDKTKVDDMLIEMITPKVKEIEENFSQGKGLSQDDINTLLLKSQYNHINHLDLKLNEVTHSAVALEGKFDKKFVALEWKFDRKLILESVKKNPIIANKDHIFLFNAF
jgi:hypothetical protein